MLVCVTIPDELLVMSLQFFFLFFKIIGLLCQMYYAFRNHGSALLVFSHPISNCSMKIMFFVDTNMCSSVFIHVFLTSLYQVQDICYILSFYVWSYNMRPKTKLFPKWNIINVSTQPLSTSQTLASPVTSDTNSSPVTSDTNSSPVTSDTPNPSNMTGTFTLYVG